MDKLLEKYVNIAAMKYHYLLWYFGQERTYLLSWRCLCLIILVKHGIFLKLSVAYVLQLKEFLKETFFIY